MPLFLPRRNSDRKGNYYWGNTTSAIGIYKNYLGREVREYIREFPKDKKIHNIINDFKKYERIEYSIYNGKKTRTVVIDIKNKRRYIK